MKKTKSIIAALLVGFIASPVLATAADDAHEFYKDKTLRLVSTTAPGGTMDLYLLLLMRHMEKHLPDSSSTILEHRQGAGGSVGANYLYSSASSDGTVVGLPVPTLVSQKYATPRNVRYNADEFQPIGRVVDIPRIHVVRADSGIGSFQELIDSEVELTHATMAKGGMFHQHMLVANEGAKTQFKDIPGYSGGGPSFLAMEQGEVNSTSAEPANLFSNKWHLVESGDVNVIAVSGFERLKELPDTPTVMEFIEEGIPEYDIANAVLGEAELGLTLLAPPGVPKERVAYLRDVFMKTVSDPELSKEAEERNIPINPADGSYMEEVIFKLSNAPEHVQEWFYNISN